MKQNFPSVLGVPICFWEGDKVKTRDGREGTVLGYEWEHDLVSYRNGISSKGFFLVIVDFGSYTEKFLRHDLCGKRFGSTEFSSEKGFGAIK